MWPLFAEAHGTDILVWRAAGRPLTRAEFTRMARQVARSLPETRYAINLCAGRLAFMLGLAAASLRRQTTLLPPNQAPETIQNLQREYPNHHVLEDSLLDGMPAQGEDDSPLLVAENEMAAVLFTSGSTGIPQPQAKTWRTLLRMGELDEARFARGRRMNVVATVPSQHMFGLQTTVFLPFAGSSAVWDARPFFPADIRQALEAVPAPRALITTPTHLRTCVSSHLKLPKVDFVLSATAVLPPELARQAEALWNTEVLEIYGSTEAGTIATRRTAGGDQWSLVSGAKLEAQSEHTVLTAAHLPEPLILQDRVELLGADKFHLLSRASENIKIAGKRATLAELTQALLSVPGVTDGAVFLPPNGERTAALAVAAARSGAEILDAMAAKIDPVFLPRPLVLVSELPRNSVGKLTQAALLAALQAHAESKP